MSKELENSLAINEKIKIINEFYKLNKNGVIVFTGGETMKKSEEFFSLTSLCRKLCLSSAANTNGTFIFSTEVAEKTVLYGPKYIIISLDSHIPEIHDSMRGVKDCFSIIFSGIERLIKIKNEKYPKIDTKIYTNSIIFDKNIHLWKHYIKFMKEIGLDGVMFQMLSRTFWNQGRGDPFFENNFFQDKKKAQCYLDEIIQEFGKDPFVLTSIEDLKWMKLYIENPDFIGEQVCGSHEMNLMVDVMGEVQLCFNMRGLMNGKSLGNVRDYSLNELWISSIAENAREKMEKCRKNCGMLNCHRKRVI